MTLHRTLAVRTAVLAGGLALVASPATPAGAHGATTDPVSRAAACGPEGGALQRSAACRAAAAANGGQDFAQWDNLRVADVAGRDRERIPDGQLCSAGLPAFRGLDLPRGDWPSTRLTAGAAYTFRYRGTIGHKGTFRLYATRDGYDPKRPVRWSDLEPKPFLTAVDPQLRSGSYELKGRLPAGRSGRHVVYAIWQNSDTPDTYYSCSDVDFPGAPGTAPPRAGAAGSAA
ncbi:MAG TPA: lytic polysaccharide monooxygenase, partial [Catenuloplanes sp.]